MSEDGSTFEVNIENIIAVEPHPNADRLELATVRGWQCVIPKGQFQVGDLVVYIPIDSILPDELEAKIFGPDSKVKLNKSRVKTIKLRGAISQGLVVKPETVGLSSDANWFNVSIGLNVTKKLGITKYEPPAKELPNGMNVKKQKRLENPNFHKYGGIENFKNYPDLFEEGEQVSVTEKIHGTNFRAGYVPCVANTIWRRVLKFFGRLPEYEFVYGSNNVQLHQKGERGGFYSFTVYGEAVEKYKLRELLKPSEVVYGEIYGAGIQKGYTYGCGPEERKLVIFDLKRSGEFVSSEELSAFCRERELPQPPELYRGPFNKNTILALTLGDSVLASAQKVREGVVVKPIEEEKSYIGRKLLKVISDTYLLGNQTDFH